MDIGSPDWNDALKISVELGITFYDGLYVQLALSGEASLLLRTENSEIKLKKWWK